jgi:hypothetical protein
MEALRISSSIWVSLSSPKLRETQVCERRAESGERRAESGERRLESGKYRFCWVILGEAMPISVELEIV